MGIEGLENLKFELGSLFKQTVPEKLHLTQKRISLQAYMGVVSRTPIDTGRARANWGITINQPQTTATDAIDKAPMGAAPANMPQMTAVAEGSKPGDAIYITNALPYILPLEEGHSKKGSHMVEVTVNNIKQHYGA